MIRRPLSFGILTAGLAFGLTVQPAHASENLTSSMTATCVGAGGSCTEVIFELNVNGSTPENFVHAVVLETNSGPWSFGNIVSVVDGNGNPVTWWGNGMGTQLFIASPQSGPSYTPLSIRVAMTGAGTAQELDGISYTTLGSTSGPTPVGSPAGPGNVGTVTPEPVTMVLLGTGLAGIAGVGARRRKNSLEHGDDT